MKKYFIAGVVCLLVNVTHAQFVIGWSAGYANSHELNRTIHVYNSVQSSTLSKEMQMVHFNHGLIAGFRFGGDDGFAELLYSRKVASVSAEADSSGVTLERQLKVLSNTWNLGGGYRITENFRIGMSFDLGRFKGKGRRGPKSSIGDQEFEKLWVLDNTRIFGIHAYKLYCATTAFAELNFGMVGFRVYYQWALTKNKMDGFDYWLLSGQTLNWEESLYDKFSNAGVMLTLQIGKR